MVKKKQISEGEIHQFLFCFVKTITVTKSKSKFTDLTLFYAELSAVYFIVMETLISSSLLRLEGVGGGGQPMT